VLVAFRTLSKTLDDNEHALTVDVTRSLAGEDGVATDVVASENCAASGVGGAAEHKEKNKQRNWLMAQEAEGASEHWEPFS
jgi:hypothetical protein